MRFTADLGVVTESVIGYVEAYVILTIWRWNHKIHEKKIEIKLLWYQEHASYMTMRLGLSNDTTSLRDTKD